MTPSELADEERLALEVHDRSIRPSLREEDEGKYVAVAFETGDYEIDAGDYAATRRLLARLPGVSDLGDAGRAGCRLPDASLQFGWGEQRFHRPATFIGLLAETNGSPHANLQGP